MVSENRRKHLANIAKLGGIAKGKLQKTPLQRFEEAIQKDLETGCWNWMNHRTSGYGQFKVDGRPVYAHRWSYEHFKGPLTRHGPTKGRRRTGDEMLCHTCDNRACVNPEHLFIGTHQDNMTDGVLKNRFGHNWHEQRNSEILAMYDAGLPVEKIGRFFDIHRQTVWRIVKHAKPDRLS